MVASWTGRGASVSGSTRSRAQAPGLGAEREQVSQWWLGETGKRPQALSHISFIGR